MKFSRVFLSLLLILMLSAAGNAYTLSGDISGAEWFGGITYVYALSLDVLNPSFYIGLALLGNAALTSWFLVGEDFGPLNPAGSTAATPHEFALCEVHPNPFNPTTVLSFKVQVASWVTLEVFDVKGRAA